MEALRKKWNSSQGASILLALLFFLVCMMVGASLLMAAASNAGKLRSNQEEQQKYLTLSSALTLMCDELTGVEYYGKYCCAEIFIDRMETDVDEEGNSISYRVYDHTEHYYWQESGEMKIGDANWKLKDVLPLFNDLDLIFAGCFKLPDYQCIPVDKYFYEPLKSEKILLKSPHSVELKVEVDESTYGGLIEPVSITAKIDEKGVITLTATLKENTDYIMEAVLDPKLDAGKAFKDVIYLNGAPAEREKLGSQLGASEGWPEKPTKLIVTEKSLTWTLRHIVKKEAAGG